MKARCTGHARALRYLADGKPSLATTATAGQMFGYRTMMGTLLKWGLIVNNSGTYVVSDRGREFLAFIAPPA
jgi:hypothetical protein